MFLCSVDNCILIKVIFLIIILVFILINICIYIIVYNLVISESCIVWNNLNKLLKIFEIDLEKYFVMLIKYCFVIWFL